MRTNIKNWEGNKSEIRNQSFYCIGCIAVDPSRQLHNAIKATFWEVLAKQYSRVAAALGYFIRLYCEERHLPEVPVPLRFAYCASRGTHRRNPSKDPYRFPIMQPNKYAMHNLRASWLLQEVVNRPSHRFYQLHEEQRLRALEAALFMIGYELPE